jgi:hypothetical protein
MYLPSTFLSIQCSERYLPISTGMGITSTLVPTEAMITDPVGYIVR